MKILGGVFGGKGLGATNMMKSRSNAECQFFVLSLLIKDH